MRNLDMQNQEWECLGSQSNCVEEVEGSCHHFALFTRLFSPVGCSSYIILYKKKVG